MGLSNIAVGLAGLIVAGEAAYAIAGSSSTLLRPPGIQGERDFMARCTKCGRCVEACHHRILRMAPISAGAAAGTPYIDAREGACHLCDGFPCAASCPTGALRDVSTTDDVHMGYAKIDEDVCIAYQGYRCEVCYRVCPLIDRAITIEHDTIENDSIHVKFIPTIDKDVCTGCGLCVQRCTVDTPHVAISIVTVAEQEKKGKR